MFTKKTEKWCAGCESRGKAEYESRDTRPGRPACVLLLCDAAALDCVRSLSVLASATLTMLSPLPLPLSLAFGAVGILRYLVPGLPGALSLRKEIIHRTTTKRHVTVTGSSIPATSHQDLSLICHCFVVCRASPIGRAFASGILTEDQGGPRGQR